MNDDFFNFDEHPEDFYIAEEMINEDNSKLNSNESCCSVLMVLAILFILITVA